MSSFSTVASRIAFMLVLCASLFWSQEARSATLTYTVVTNNNDTNINLTTDGTTDWIHWARSAVGDVDRKNVATNYISNYTVVGAGTPARITNSTMRVNWTDGTPMATHTESANAGTMLSLGGINNGFQIVVPADTTTRTVKLYAGAISSGTGMMRAFLSDGSAANIIDVTTGATNNSTFTITYAAASPNQTLTITWTNATATGSVTLSSVTLQGGAPPATTNFTWSGADFANNTFLSNGANWVGGVAPTGIATENLIFPAAASSFAPQNDFAAGTNFGSIAFYGNHTLSGNAIALNGNVTASTNATTSVNLNLQQVVAGRTFAADAGSTLTLGGTVDANSLTLTVNPVGTGLISINNIAGPGTFVTAGTGNVQLTGAISNLTSISLAGTGTFTQSAASVISGTTTTTLNAANGNFIFAGANTHSGATTLTNGNLFIGSDSVPAVSGPLGLGTLNNNGGTIAASGAARSLNNTVLMGGNMTINGTFDLTFTGSVQMNNADRTFTINSTSPKGAIFANSQNPASDTAGAIVRGPAPTANRNMTKAGFGQMTIQGICVGQNQVFVTAGTILLEGTLGKFSAGAGTPDIRIDANATVILDYSTLPVAGGVNERVDDNDVIHLNGKDATLVLRGNASSAIVERIATLVFAQGEGIVKIQNESTTGNGDTTLLCSSNILFQAGATGVFVRENLSPAGTGFTRLRAGALFVDEQPMQLLTVSTITGVTSTLREAAKYDRTPTDLGVVPFTGKVFTSIASGNWDNATTWTPAPAAGEPGASDHVVVDDDHVIDLNGADRAVTSVRFNRNGKITGTNRLAISALILADNQALTPEIACDINLAGGLVEASVPGLSTTLTLSGAIHETGGARTLIKTGVGYLKLSSPNSDYTGGTWLGTPNTAPTVTTVGTTTTFNATALAIYNAAMLVNRTITMTSGPASGEVRTISAFNPATSLITVSSAFSAAPTVGNTFIVEGFTGKFGGPLVLDADTTGAVTNGPIGTGTLFLNNGVLPLTFGPNNLTIQAGTATGRTIANAIHNTMASTNTVTLGGTQPLTFTGNVSLGANLLLICGVDATFSGIISGTPTFTKHGSGVILLSGASTFSGGFTLASGPLKIGSDSVGAITSGPVGTGTFTINAVTTGGGAIQIPTTLEAVGANRTVANKVNLNGDFTVLAGNNLVLGRSTQSADLSANRTVTINNNTTLDSRLTNNFTFTKNGTGTLLLTQANNSYTGATTVNGGVLTLSGDVATLTNTTSITVNAGGTFEISGGAGAANPNRILDTCQLNLNGGAFRIIQIAGATVARTESIGVVRFGAGSTLRVDCNTATFGCSLTSSSTALGATEFINNGSLNFERIDGGGGATAAFFINNATLFDVPRATVNGQFAEYKGTATATGLVAKVSTASRFTVNNGNWGDAATWDAGGVPATTANVVIRHLVALKDSLGADQSQTANSISFDQGAGTGITGASGRTLTVSSGAINVGGTAAPTIGNPTGATFDLVFGGVEGIINQASSGALVVTASISSASTAGLTVGGSGSTTLSGSLGFSGGLRVRGGQCTVSGNNTFTGGTSVQGGTLSISSDLNLGAVAGGIMLGGASVGTLTIGAANDVSLSSARGFALSTGGGIVDVPLDRTLTINSPISGNFTLTKNGAGRVTFAGTGSTRGGANVFTVVNAGILRAGSNDFLGNVVNDSCFITLYSGTTLEIAHGVTAAGPKIAMNNGSKLIGIGNATAAFNNIVPQQGATVIVEHQPFQASNAFTLNNFAGTNGNAPLAAQNNTLTLLRANSGRIVLGGSNSFYEGTWIIESGIVQANNGTSFGDNGPVLSTVTVNAGATLCSNTPLATPVILNGGTFGASGGNGGASVTGGQGNNAGAQSLIVTAPSTINLDDVVTPGTARIVTISGILAGTAPLTVNGLNGTTALILSNLSNVYTGQITVNSNAVLQAQNPGSLGVAGSLIPVVLAGGTLDLRSSLSNTGGVYSFNNDVTVMPSVGDVTSISTITVQNNGGTNPTLQTIALNSLNLLAPALAITTPIASNYALKFSGAVNIGQDTVLRLDSANLTFDGVVSGLGSVTKTGLGTLFFNNTASYSGATTINSGAISINGSTGALYNSVPNGLITVNASGTLQINSNGTTADYDRLPDDVVVTLNGGTFAISAPSNVTRTETIKRLQYGPMPGRLALNASGTGNAALTTQDALTRIGAGTLQLQRNFTSALNQANLYTGDAVGTTFPYVTVAEPSATNTGIYAAGSGENSGVIADAPAVGAYVYTSAASGDWDNPATWTSSPAGGTTPTIADDVIISAGHNVSLNGADRAARSVRFMPNPVNVTSGITGTNTLTVATGNISVDPNSDLAGSGLLGDYYNSNNFNTYVMSRVENINKGSGNFDPDADPVTGTNGVLTYQNFSIVWSGFVRADFTELYTLGFAVDDGVRIYFDNQLIVDSWTGQGVGNPYLMTVPMTAGVKIPIRIEYFNGGGNSGWIFSWNSASQTGGVQTVVPAANLFAGSAPITITSNLSFGSATGSINNNGAGTLNLTGSIAGTGGLVINSNGSVAPKAVNTYTGGTKLIKGFLQLGDNNALSSDPLTVSGGTLAANINSNATVNFSNTIIADTDIVLGASPGTLNHLGTIQLTGSRSVYAANPNQVNLLGTITDSGNSYNFTKDGFGTILIASPLAHGGDTYLIRGTLTLGVHDALPVNKPLYMRGLNILGYAATLNLNNFNQTLPAVIIMDGGALGTPNQITSGNAATLTINTASNTSFAGLLAGGMALTKTGVGTLILGGPSNNTYSGTTTVQNGTLRLGYSNAIPNASTVMVNAGATLDLANFSDQIGGTGAIYLNGGTITSNLGVMTIGDATGAIDVYVTAPGSVINGAVAFTANREFNVAAGSDLTVNAFLSGAAGAITKSGAGTMVLNNVSTYTGVTTVNDGVLQLNGNAATIANSSSLVLNGGTFLIDATAGGANPNRIGDTATVVFNGGNFTMLAPNNVTRTETVGVASFDGGNSAITLTPQGTGSSQLTLTTAGALPSRSNGATFNFVRPAATPGTANLFFSGGVAGTSIPFGSVNGNLATYDGNTNTGEGCIDATGAANTYITQQDGTWDGTLASTAFGGQVIPAGANVIIRHAVTVTSAVAPSSILFDQNLATGTYGLAAAAAQTVTVSSGLVATSGTAAPTIDSNITLAFGGTTGLLKTESSGILTVNARITGTAGLSKSGSGTAVLTNAASTYTATTTILAGTLRMSADTATATDGILGPSANTVTLAGGTYLANATFSSARVFTTLSNSTGSAIDVQTGLTLTLTGAIAGGTPLEFNSGAGLNGTNGGTVEFTIAGTRTGANTINGGTVRVAALAAGACLGTGSITINDGALEAVFTAAANERLPNALIMNDKAVFRGIGPTPTTSFTSGTIFVAPGAQIALQTGSTPSDVLRLFSAGNQLSGGGGGATVTVTGAGRVQFMQDNNNNAFVGNYIVNSTVLMVNAAGSLSTPTNRVTINAGGSFMTNAAVTAGYPIVLNGGTLAVNNNTGTFSGPVSVLAPSTLSTLGLAGSTPFQLTISGQLSGSAAVTLAGNGSSVRLTNPASPYNGIINIGSGGSTTTFELNASNSPLTAGPPCTLVWGGTTATLNLRSDQSTAFTATAVLNGNATISVDRINAPNTGRILSLSSLSIGASTLNVTGGSTYSLNFPGATLTGVGSTSIFNPTTAPLILNGAVVDGGNANGIRLTNGTMTLSGTTANTYTGDTTVNLGTLNLNKTAGVNAIGGNLVIGDGTGVDTVQLLAADQIPNTASVTINRTSGRLAHTNNNETVGSLVDSGTGTGSAVSLGSGTLTIASNADATFSGAIGGTGSLVKTGAFAQTLAGTSTYTGATTVQAGTLQVNGSIASSDFSVDGGTLGGSGTVGTISGTASGGTVNPGSPVSATAVLSSGDVALDAATTFSANLNGATAGTGYDQLNVTGTVNLNGATLNLAFGFTPAVGAAFVLVNNDGADAISGTFAGLAEGANLTLGGLRYQITYAGGTNANDVVLTRIKDNTTTNVVSSLNPSTYGQTISFTATVTGVAPGAPTATGSVQFTLDGSNFGAPVALTAGSATSMSVSTIDAGNHIITAIYLGDVSFNGSTSGNLTQIINQSDTSIPTLNSSSNPSVFGEPVTFSVTVGAVAPGAGTPSGNVDFVIDGISNVVALNGFGLAQYTTSTLSLGNHTVVANYQGDTNFKTSTATLAGGQTVNQASSSTAVSSSSNPSVFGQGISFTATVSPVAPSSATPTGAVQFLVDGVNYGAPIALVGGTASTPVDSTFAVGSYVITVNYSGSAQFAASNGTLAPNQVVNKASVTNTVTSSQNPSTFGQSVTFTSTVATQAPGSGTPAGTVQWQIDGVNFGAPVALDVNGMATLTTSTLTSGTHPVAAVYSGNGSYNGATGNLAGGQVVNASSTTTAVASDINPSVFGQGVTFTATVSPVAPGTGTPTGTIQFQVDGVNAGAPVALVAGAASTTISTLSVATHAITAIYSGSTDFSGSTGTLAGGQVVNQASSATAVSSSSNPSDFGQGISFTATVTSVAPGAGTPTGTVQFQVGGVNYGAPITLAAGVATTAVDSTFAAGTYVITAIYSGSTSHIGSTGTLAPNQLVNPATTATAVASSVNPSLFGESVTFSATVTTQAPGSGTPTGTVQFQIDGVNFGAAVPLVAGSASSNAISSLAVGNHPVTAIFSGSANFNGSTGTLAGGQDVNQTSTTTAVTSSVNPSVFGQAVSFTATVSAVAPGAGTPSGTVQFQIGGVNYGTAVNLVGGVASTPPDATLPVGNYVVTAIYGGDTSFTGSNGTLAGGQTVNQASTSTAVASSANPSVFGQGVQFTATVSAVAPGAGVPDGNVQFQIDGVNYGGTVNLVNGSASSLVNSSLLVGAYSVTAIYSGSVSFIGSTGALAGGQVVNHANTTTTIISSNNPSSLNQSVTFTVTVAAVAPGAGTPTGTVDFYDGATLLGNVALNGSGVAQFTTSTLTAGNHMITADYSGSASFNASSTPLPDLIQSVQDRPIADPQTVTTPEDTALAIALTGSEANNQPLTYTITVLPQHGSISGTPPNVVYTPNLNYNGVDTFTFTVSSPFATSLPAVVTINITPVNDTPAVQAQAVVAVEDVGLNITLAGVDNDPEVAQVLTYVIVTQPAHGTLSNFNAATGQVTYTSNENYNGPDSFTFTVMDDASAGPVTNLSSAPATVTINVSPSNDRPEGYGQTIVSGYEKPLIITLSGEDGDEDAVQVLTFAIATQPVNGTLANLNPQTGVVTYIPNTGFSGTDSFTFTITDDAAAGTPAGQISVAATINITITPPPSFTSPPSVTPDAVIAGQPVVFGAATTSASTIVWDFGDGTSATGPSVTHIYTTPGVYVTTVTATSPEGVVSTSSVTIFVSSSTSSATNGGGALPPGVTGILVGGAGQQKPQGGAGKLSVNFVDRSRTSMGGSIGQLVFPAGMTLSSITGAQVILTLGKGPLAQVYNVSLDKRGKGKATSVQKLQIDMKKKRMSFKVGGRAALTEVAESIGATYNPAVKKGDPVIIYMPATLQVGTQYYLAMSFEMVYRQSGTKGKADLRKP